MRWRSVRPYRGRGRRSRAVVVSATSPTNIEVARLSGDLSEARDMIVQLQRELERARGVIEQQRIVMQNGGERDDGSRGGR